MSVSDLKYASDIFKEYGWFGLLVCVFVFLFISMMKSAWIKRIYSYLSEKFIERFIRGEAKKNNLSKSLAETDIINHDINNYIDFWMYSKIPTIRFNTDYRTAVFRKYLTLYLKSYKNNINDFITSRDYQNMDDSEIWTSFLNLINKTVYNYESEMREQGIPDVIIEKMKIRNNDTITLTIDLIEGICTSEFYISENNYLKVYSILNILLSVLENTVYRSEDVCNAINGQLKGLTFGGFTEP